MPTEVCMRQVNWPLGDYLLYTTPKEKQHGGKMLRRTSLGQSKTQSRSLRSVPTALLHPIHIRMSEVTSHVKRNLSVVLYNPKGASYPPCQAVTSSSSTKGASNTPRRKHGQTKPPGVAARKRAEGKSIKSSSSETLWSHNQPSSAMAPLKARPPQVTLPKPLGHFSSLMDSLNHNKEPS